MLVKFEQNRVVQTTGNFELFDKTKQKQNKTKQNKTKKKKKKKRKKRVFYNHFWQRVDVNLEDVSVTETIVWYLNINLKTIII